MARTRRKKKRPSKQDVSKARNRVLTNLGIDLAFDKVGDKLRSKINGIVNEYFSGEDFTGKAGMMKGLDHLVVRAFGNRGQLTGKDFSTAAWKGALAEGKDYYYGTDLGKTTVGKVGGSGVFAGIADVGSQMINKGEVNPVLTGAAMAKSTAKEGFKQYAAGAGMSKAAGAVGGAMGAGVVQGFADLYRTGSVSKSTEMGTMGAAIGSIVPGVGTVIGGLIGSALGSLMDSRGGGPAPRVTYTYDSPDGKNGIYYDKETKKYRMAKPIDVSIQYGGGRGAVYANLSPQHKQQLLRDRQRGMVVDVQRMAQEEKEYESMGARDQLGHEKMMAKHSYKAPRTEAEYKAEFRKQRGFTGLEGPLGDMADLGYTKWRQDFDKYNATDHYVMGRPKTDADILDDSKRKVGGTKWYKAFTKPVEEMNKKQGYFDPVKGWTHISTDPNAGSYQSDDIDNQVMKELERKKRLGGTLTPTQEKALGIDSTKQLPSVGALGALGAKASDEDWTPKGMYGEEAELYREETKQMRQKRIGIFGNTGSGNLYGDGSGGMGSGLGSSAGASDTSSYDASEQEGGWGSHGDSGVGDADGGGADSV